MATAAQTRSSSSTTRFRSNPKHFLTWSATAANHKIQKLSKNFVQNVSKLQSKMEKALHQANSHHTPTHQQWDPSCMENNDLSGCSSASTSHYNNDSSSSANLMANMSNVNVAVVHALNVTRNKSCTNSDSSTDESNNNNNNNNLFSSTNNKVSEWKNASRLRRRFDFEVERCNLAKSLDGIDMDMLELRPMVSSSLLAENSTILDRPLHDEDDNSEIPTNHNHNHTKTSSETETLVTGTFNLITSSSSNNTSLSTISIGATTIPVTSPHW